MQSECDDKQWRLTYVIHYVNGECSEALTRTVRAASGLSAEEKVKASEIEHCDGCPIRTFDFKSVTTVK